MGASTYPSHEDVANARALVYRAMLAHSTPHILEDSVRCGIRLLQTFPPDAIHNNKVFVAYGGGKDSSYMVAFVRLMQILIFRQYETTFQLRVVTNRHSGMPKSVMENIDRAYKSLGLYEDPDVELLLIDGDAIQPFDLAAPYPASLRERSRLDILMTGHRCEGEARPTFCNACNLSMVHSFGLAHDMRNEFAPL
jgi:hypothetical protein